MLVVVGRMLNDRVFPQSFLWDQELDTQSNDGRYTLFHIFLCGDHGAEGAEAQRSCQLGKVFPPEDLFKLFVIAAPVVRPQSVVIILGLQEHCLCSFKFVEATVLSNPAVVKLAAL